MPDDSPALQSARFLANALELHWVDGRVTSYHPFWLRDNCRCEICGEPSVGYRDLRTTSIDPDCRIDEIETTHDRLKLTWNDGHRSEYTADWLRMHAYDDDSRRERVFHPVLWDDDFRHNPPLHDFRELDSDAALLELLTQLRDRGIAIVRGAPAEPGVGEAFAVRIGYPQENNFGRIQDLRFDPSKRSIANDVRGLKAHTDEPYRASPPGLLLFHCIRNDQTGAGWSLFMDGFELAERLRAHDPEGFQALCDYPHSFRRHFDGDVDLIAEFPLLSVDEFGNLSGVRINDRVAAPLQIPAQALDVYYRGLRYLLQQAEDDALTLKLRLQPGDIVLFDNHRTLHGRSDLTIDGQRWLQWIQIERGDFHSSLRIIADRIGVARDINPLLRGAYG